MTTPSRPSRRLNKLQSFYWTVTNCGVFQCDVYCTRREATAAAERRAEKYGHTDWRNCYEIRKVVIQESQ